MSNWQTIDTAPKDGTTIQITDGRSVYAGAWAPSIHGSKYPWAFIEVFASDPHGCCDKEDGTRIESNAFPVSGPTHWQPLAEPPLSPPTTETDASIDDDIDKILSDNSPVEPNSSDVLLAKLGITQGQNRMMADALEKSLHIMRSYQRIGYGDDVYMSALCDAIRHAERAIDYFKVDLPAPTNTTLDEQERGA